MFDSTTSAAHAATPARPSAKSSSHSSGQSSPGAERPVTNSLLIDEPPLQVLPSLAVHIGLNEALILQQIHYWLKIKRTDPTRYADSYQQGTWWVYNSVRQWQEQFPFWSKDTIQRTLTSLKSQGILRVEQLSPDSRDRTNWYAIQYDRLQALTPPPPPADDIPADPINALPQNAAMDDRKLPQSIAARSGNARVHSAAVQTGKTPQCLISETSSKTTQRLPQKAAPPPGVLPAASGEKPPDKAPDRNSSSGTASDPLASLPPDEYATLEQRARNKVIAELGSPICDLARQGKATRDVKAMMRELLRQEPRGTQRLALECFLAIPGDSKRTRTGSPQPKADARV